MPYHRRDETSHDRGSLRWGALGLFLLSACVRNPVTGSRELVLLSAARERQIGEEAAARVGATMGLLKAPLLSGYVRELGSRLAAHSPRQGMRHQFDIVDVAPPNAFALPDGHVYVSRGLLALTNSEDELAGILSHELGHVAARHANQRYSRGAPLEVLTGVTSALVGVVSSDVGSAVASVGGGLNAVLLAPYGRSQEHEADRVGQNIAFASGWDPAALSDALLTLGRFEKLFQRRPDRTSWLDSHPATAERVALTRRHARSLGPAPQMSGTARELYVRRLEGLVVGTDPIHGVFRDRQFLHPSSGAALEFPQGWVVGNSRRNAFSLTAERDALCLFSDQGVGDEPHRAAWQFAEQEQFAYGSGPSSRTIGSVAGVQATAVSEELHFTFVFAAIHGHVIRLLAVTPLAKRAYYAPVFESWLSSLREAEQGEIAGIEATRLRVVPVGESDTLAGVLSHYATALSPQLVAIVNGMASSRAQLPARVLKLPVREPYGAQ